MSSVSPHQPPMPVRLWELILVQATFAISAGIYATELSWMRESSTTIWTVAILGGIRTGVAPLLVEDLALGVRSRWSLSGRLCLALLVLTELGRVPSFLLFESRGIHLDATLGVPAILFAVIALGGRGRKTLWGWLPFGLCLASPALAWWLLQGRWW